MCCDRDKCFYKQAWMSFFFQAHILYPSSVLFAQLDVHRVQFSLQLPLYANVIAALWVIGQPRAASECIRSSALSGNFLMTLLS